MQTFINNFAISHLPNERLFNYVQIVDTQFGQAAISQLNMVYQNFHTAVQDFQVKLEPVHYTAYSNAIKDKDKERDSVYYALEVVTKAYTRSPIAAEAEAATLMLSVFDKYDDIRKEDYNQESGSVFNFVEELETHHQQHLTTLHLTEWVNILRTRNQEFAALYDNRNVQERTYVSYKEVQAARQTLLNCYHELIECFEAAVKMGMIPNGSYQTLVQTINEYIDREIITLNVAKGRKKAKKEKENAENGGTPETPTNNNGSDNNGGENGGESGSENTNTDNTDPNQGEDNTPSANA